MSRVNEGSSLLQEILDVSVFVPETVSCFLLVSLNLPENVHQDLNQAIRRELSSLRQLLLLSLHNSSEIFKAEGFGHTIKINEPIDPRSVKFLKNF